MKLRLPIYFLGQSIASAQKQHRMPVLTDSIQFNWKHSTLSPQVTMEMKARFSLDGVKCTMVLVQTFRGLQSKNATNFSGNRQFLGILSNNKKWRFIIILFVFEVKFTFTTNFNRKSTNLNQQSNSSMKFKYAFPNQSEWKWCTKPDISMHLFQMHEFI